MLKTLFSVNFQAEWGPSSLPYELVYMSSFAWNLDLLGLKSTFCVHNVSFCVSFFHQFLDRIKKMEDSPSSSRLQVIIGAIRILLGAIRHWGGRSGALLKISYLLLLPHKCLINYFWSAEIHHLTEI